MPASPSPILRTAAFAAAIAFAACSDRLENVAEFDVNRLPVAGFRDMAFLGITKAKGIDAKSADILLKRIQRCGQYERVNHLGRVIELAPGDAEATLKKLRGDLANYQDSRYVHGVLVMQIIKRNTVKDTSATRLVHVKESADHEWFDSYGYASTPQSSLFGTEEIGPKLTFDPKPVTMKRTSSDIGLRYALYNKKTDAIVFDRSTFIATSVSTYSDKAKVNAGNIERLMLRDLMERIARSACPRMTAVNRTLYATKSDSKVDGLVASGVTAAGDDRWDEAADLWRKAILSDKSNPFAHHDLGVYYERAGNAPAAMEEFKKARDNGGKRLNVRQYDESLNVFLPKLSLVGLEPRLYSVSGANWATIYGGRPGAVVVGREYQVYRMRRLTAAGSFRVDGTELTETGRVKILKSMPPFLLGRITQFVDSARADVGDIVMTAGVD